MAKPLLLSSNYQCSNETGDKMVQGRRKQNHALNNSSSAYTFLFLTSQSIISLDIAVVTNSHNFMWSIAGFRYIYMLFINLSSQHHFKGILIAIKKWGRGKTESRRVKCFLIQGNIGHHAVCFAVCWKVNWNKHLSHTNTCLLAERGRTERQR